MASLNDLPSSKALESGQVTHINDVEDAKDDTLSPTVTQDIVMATQQEYARTAWQAIKHHRKACFWSAVVSLAIIMDGYDSAILGSLPAFPAFQYQFGHKVAHKDKYQLDAKWQVALSLSNPVGAIFGIYLNAVFTELFGHKKILLSTLTLLIGIIFIPFFAKSIEMLFAGELLSGLAWGVFTTMAPAYASEVCPVVLRSYLETFVVLCWGIGQFLSFAVLASYSSAPQSDHWSWRIPIAIQWIWPVIIIPLALFAPESPWWLVRHDRINEAEEVMKRLSDDDETQIKQSVTLMVHTNQLEKTITYGTSVFDCFKGTNLRRTEIACVIWAMQQISGFVITGYATYFYEQAGLAPVQAFHFSVGQSGLHFLCTMVAFWLTGRYGRRVLVLWGMFFMGICMFIIGFISLAPASTAQGYGESAVYLLWFCVYELTIGPVAYIVVGEVSTTRLRSHTVGLARISYNLVNIINSVVGPYILNPTKGNWKGKCGFLTGGLIVFCTLWTWFRLPETSRRTYEELDILFEQKTKTRDFKTKQVDIVQDSKDILIS